MVAVECADLGIDQLTVLKGFEDIEQSYRIRTARQAYDNDATVKQPFALGEFKDSVRDQICRKLGLIFFQNQNPFGKSSCAPAKKSSPPSIFSGGISSLSGIGGSGIGPSSVVILSKL